jgi:tripartite-type tricarboxylate transporter receptor subunit TctC
MKKTFTFLLLAAAQLGWVGTVGTAAASTFPTKPITLLMPFPPGGGTDTHLRALSLRAGQLLGQPIVIETKSGASGSVALTYLARTSQPDGYTLSVVVPTSFRLPLIQKMNYEPMKDLTYVSRLSGYAYVIAVRADSPWRTWRDLVNYARANPGKLNYGNAGENSTTHLVMEQIAAAEKISWTAVPFKGDGDQILSLLGGQIDIGSPSMGVAPHVEGGKLRLLAIWTKDRAARFPDVPTLQEQGTNMVAEVPYGLVGPAGMDPAVVNTIAEAFRKASAEESNKAMLRQLGQVDLYMSPAEFTAWAQKSYASERELIQKLSKKPQ